jgi:hypothetical protein
MAKELMGNVGADPGGEEDEGFIQVPPEDTPGDEKGSGEENLIPLVVDGTEQRVTLEKAKELAQKGVAAEKRFQEAAQMRKEAERGVRVTELLKKVTEEHDLDSFRELCKESGLNEEQTEQAIAVGWQEEGEEVDTGPEPDDTKGVLAELKKSIEASQRRKLKYDDLDTDLKRAFEDMESGRISKIVQNSLDKHPKIGYYMRTLDDKGQKAIRDMIHDGIQGRLDEVGGDFGDGSQVLPQVLSKVSERLEALGSPERTTPPTGLGPSPGVGTSGSLPEKAPEHVSSSEAGFEQHILEMIVHNARKAESGKL